MQGCGAGAAVLLVVDQHQPATFALLLHELAPKTCLQLCLGMTKSATILNSWLLAHRGW